LSYIFNNFEGTRTFSNVVAEAKEAGYTEPDPRDDLSGTDVARKVEQHIYNNTMDQKYTLFWFGLA
jgi:aspartokinase/homoserine dehydrogenase 1